ncbi:MAG TPA: circularly permuted type 2 ATP-grasp protein, partial [Bryobacteraceae bacterium]|nr:circularly permuted type 2 ATP-grasp protein [Bryobacteraceae bacterium]
VLENAGLIPHLPHAARALLGEELLLPMPATWWCGDAPARSHVLAHLERLVLKPISRAGNLLRYGWQLSADERVELTARINAEPWAWCGQRLTRWGLGG